LTCSSQIKLLEILAAGALNATAILFTIVTVLLGTVWATGKRSEVRNFASAVNAFVLSVGLAMLFTVVSVLALRYRTSAFYACTLVLGGLTVAVLFGAAVWLGCLAKK
jgi:hypothetical protein